MANQTPGFLRLPVELRTDIISYITSKQDLKGLCLTCKELQDVARPQLYHTIVLYVAQLTAAQSAALSGQNAALQYVRSLAIVPQLRALDAETHGSILCDILNALPKNCLEYFVLDTLEPIPLEVLFLLRTRQSQALNFQLHPVEHLDQGRLIPDKGDLRHIRTVQLYITSIDDCETAYQVLQRAQAIARLDVSVDDTMHLEYIDKWHAHCDMLTTLFRAHDESQQANPRIRLETLRLYGLDLHQAHNATIQLLELSALQDLILEDCEDTNVFFEGHGERMRTLRSITNVRVDDSNLEYKDAFQELLDRSTALVDIKVSHSSLGGYKTCDWSAIRRHGTSLRSLYLDDFQESHSPIGVQGTGQQRTMLGLRQMCTSCQALQQLAMKMPSRDERNWSSLGGLTAFLACLSELKSLRLLKLFTAVRITHVAYKDAQLDPLRRIYEADRMQQVANKVFRDLCSNGVPLSALVLELRKDGQDCRTQGLKRFGFLRGQQTDLLGRSMSVGIPIEVKMVRHYVQPSNILEDEYGLVRQ